MHGRGRQELNKSKQHTFSLSVWWRWLLRYMCTGRHLITTESTRTKAWKTNLLYIIIIMLVRLTNSLLCFLTCIDSCRGLHAWLFHVWSGVYLLQQMQNNATRGLGMRPEARCCRHNSYIILPHCWECTSQSCSHSGFLWRGSSTSHHQGSRHPLWTLR